MSSPVVVSSPPAFMWKRALWKGLRPALIAAGAAAIAAFAESIRFEWLVELGVPTVLALFVVETIRNYFKQHAV